MSFDRIKELPSPEEIKREIPLSNTGKKIKEDRDRQLKNIFRGEDDRFIVIIGPCSADNEEAVLDYLHRLKKIVSGMEDKMFFVPRVYTNKPRTTGEGYKGLLHQPDANKKPNLDEGLKAIRKLHVKAIEEMGFICADEMLYPENYEYLSDLLGYVAVGARSVENQLHRLTISGLDVPSGMKNPTSGDISVMFNSIKAAKIGHTFIYRGHWVETKGNPLTHAILRGYLDQYGRNFPNYHFEDVKFVIEEYKKRGFSYPAIIIDMNHSNSNKRFYEQPRIAHEVIRNLHYNDEIKQYVKGIMIESYIEEGRQEPGGGVYGKSITDACLGIDATEKMLMDIYGKL